MGGADLDVQVGVADGVTDLLESTAGCEHCKGRCKGHQASGGHTGSDTDHVGLCDTAVKETLGECLLEGAGLGSTCQVSIQNDQIVVGLAQLNQCVAVAVTGCDLLNICHD